MTKISPFTNILFLLIAIVLGAISQCSSAVSNKRLCHDPKCAVPVSLAKTLLTYSTPDPQLMSFRAHTEVTVYSKEAGERDDLWGVEINGKRGYVPKTMLRESKVLQTNLSYEVPVPEYNIKDNKENVKHKDKKGILNDALHDGGKKETSHEKNHIHDSDKRTEKKTEEQSTFPLDNVSAPYDVIDGTTVPLENNEQSVNPNPVTERVEKTVVPKEPILTGGIFNVLKPKSKVPDNHNGLQSSEEVLEILAPTVVENDVHTSSIKSTEKKDILDNEEILPPDSNNTTADIDDKPQSAPVEKLSTNVNISDVASEGSNLPKEGVFEVLTPTFVENVTDTSPVNSVDQKSILDNKEIMLLVSNNATADLDDKLQNVSVENLSANVNTSEDITSQGSNVTIYSNPQEETPEKIHDNDPLETVASLNDSHIPDIVTEKLEASTNETHDVTINYADRAIEQETAETSGISHKLDDEKLIDDKLIKEKAEDEKLIKEKVEDEKVENEKLVDEERENDKLVVNEKLENVQLDNETVPTPVEDNVSSEVPLLNISSGKEGNLSETESQLPINDVAPDHAINNIVTNISEVQDIIQNEIQINQEESKPGSDAIDGQVHTVANVESVNNNVNNDDHPTQADDVDTSNVSMESSASEQQVETANFYDNTQLLQSSQDSMISEQISNFNEFPSNRNLLNVEENIHYDNGEPQIENSLQSNSDEKTSQTLPEYVRDITEEDKVLNEEVGDVHNDIDSGEVIAENLLKELQVTIGASSDTCTADDQCTSGGGEQSYDYSDSESGMISAIKMEHNYWDTFIYVGITAFTTLLFSLGYYYIENVRRDGQLIAKINKLEQELLVSTKECMILDESLRATKSKLSCIEDESFGSNEMVLSLKADLEASQNSKAELEDQVALLEKDLESATEAGLELERMLREVLSSNNEVNPLAQSVEDLQARLNAQQAANESLTNALNLKAQEHEFDKMENEALMADLASTKKRCDELDVELTQVMENLKSQISLKNNMEQTLTERVQQMEMQIKEISKEKSALYKELKGKEVEVTDLVEVINQVNSNHLDLDKLYDVSRVKAELIQLREERDDLKIRLSEVDGAHNLLEEHVKLVKEEMSALTDQCKLAEKEKKDAETRLEVLSNFFKEKEAQRQKEEAAWLHKQGEVMSTVERIQTMQNEIQNYKQQVEMLKREIVDQEREYKSQISALETKAHEQWVIARQNERRIEESKAEAAQLRNRLTLIEKNINDADPDIKLHRMEANGETTTSPPLFIGAESSNSPIIFTGSSGVPPPPPPSYMHIFPPYLPPPLPSGSGVPPYDVGQRPPPLGGRLSSPPPMPLHPPATSRSPPPPPFSSDHVHPPPPPIPGSMLPPSLGTSHSWGEETLPPIRNSGFHPHQREQRARIHKGSLHSSGESLDKTHHSGKV